jgi:hypothetical protein
LEFPAASAVMQSAGQNATENVELRAETEWLTGLSIRL